MTDKLHRMAQLGFEVGAKSYSVARPSYPSLVARSILTQHARGAAARGGVVVDHQAAAARVLDVAAGTGKFTECLLNNVEPQNLTAVEPVEGMREEFTLAIPDVRCIEGTAEAMPAIGTGSVDIVTCAQAFHWFHPQRALTEIHRVLRPATGLLAIVFNVKNPLVAWVRELDAITGADAPDDRPRHSRFRATFADELAKHGGFETPMSTETFANSQTLNKHMLVHRVASQSWVGSMPVEEREELLERVQRFYDEHWEIKGREWIHVGSSTRGEKPPPSC